MSRMVRRFIRQIAEEHPGWNEAEVDHLQRPRNDEARQLLGILPALQVLPLGDDLDELDVAPILRLALEGVALDCQREGDVGIEARRSVKAFLDALHDGLHETGHDSLLAGSDAESGSPVEHVKGEEAGKVPKSSGKGGRS